MASDVDNPALRTLSLATIASVVLSGVVFWRSANTAFASPKLAVVLVCAVIAIGAIVWRVLDRAVIELPRGAAVYALGAFVVVGALAVVTSDARWRSLYGTYRRGAGFLVFLAAAVLFVGALRVGGSPRRVRQLVSATLAGGTVIALYALLQRAGGDPFEWGREFGPDAPIATFGNTNFVSGYLGALVPLAVGFALATAGRLRIASAAVAVVLAAAVVATRSSQGVVAAGAGVAVIAAVLIAERVASDRRRVAFAGLGAAVALAAIVTIAGLSGTGPAARFGDTGYDFRRTYWEASISMAADEPLLGVGFDRWAGFYRAHRDESAGEDSVATVTDEPHSVPLGMLAGGGFPLALAYLAVVVATGWALVHGLRRSSGSSRLLLGALGAAWVGYQVQSAVSIDLPSHVVLHLVLAGAIVGAAGAVRWQPITLDLLRRSGSASIGGRVRPAGVRSRLEGGGAMAVAAVIVIAGLWLSTRPLRADMAVKSGSDRFRAGDPAGVDDLRDANDLLSWEPEYWSEMARLFVLQRNVPAALALYERAIEHDGRSFENVLNAARMAARSGAADVALTHYERALELEPHARDLKAEVGRYHIEIGQLEAGIELLERAVDGADEQFDARADLVQAYVTAERTADAEALVDGLAADVQQDDQPGLLALARSLRLIGRLDDARATIDDALLLSDGVVDVLFEAGQIAEAQGRIEDAIAHYELILLRAPNDQVDDAQEQIDRLRGNGAPEATG